ncbi:hypothetical protein AJ88_48775 [Mesorhizobium amorphae CCBAU 01583]|nr:hypothetical protein AJ88_48775 [Mesorhizobium amorphae CCBAU 01583]
MNHVQPSIAPNSDPAIVCEFDSRQGRYHQRGSPEMTEEAVQRRLTPILAAGVVGYSRLMSFDVGG